MVLYVRPRDWAEAQERLRQSFDPAAGGPGAKASDCRDCGGEFWQWKGDGRRYCPSCGAERQRRQQLAAIETARRRWLERMRAELDELERGAP